MRIHLKSYFGSRCWLLPNARNKDPCCVTGIGPAPNSWFPNWDDMTYFFLSLTYCWPPSKRNATLRMSSLPPTPSTPEKHVEQTLVSLLPAVKLSMCWDAQTQNLWVNPHWKWTEKCVEVFLPTTCYLARELRTEISHVVFVWTKRAAQEQSWLPIAEVQEVVCKGPELQQGHGWVLWALCWLNWPPGCVLGREGIFLQLPT